jgi:hypothetical protein
MGDKGRISSMKDSSTGTQNLINSRGIYEGAPSTIWRALAPGFVGKIGICARL